MKMTLAELDYWVRRVDGYIREMNDRLNDG